MFTLIKAAFLQRRKTLVNAVSAYPPAALSKEKAAAALMRCGLSPLVRGEVLSLEQFAALTEAVLAEKSHE